MCPATRGSIDRLGHLNLEHLGDRPGLAVFVPPFRVGFQIVRQSNQLKGQLFVGATRAFLGFDQILNAEQLSLNSHRIVLRQSYLSQHGQELSRMALEARAFTPGDVAVIEVEEALARALIIPAHPAYRVGAAATLTTHGKRGIDTVAQDRVHDRPGAVIFCVEWLVEVEAQYRINA